MPFLPITEEEFGEMREEMRSFYEREQEEKEREREEYYRHHPKILAGESVLITVRQDGNHEFKISSTDGSMRIELRDPYGNLIE